MESGLYYPYLAPRKIDEGKILLWSLPRKFKILEAREPDDRASLIHLNSTYMDMIDRWYSVRGGARSALLTLMSLVAVAADAIGIYFTVLAFKDGVPIAELAVGTLVILALPVMFIKIARPILGREFFSYTHYPIRLNRKTRMIHVFRHNGPSGVLSVSWDEAFFHIGQGTQDRDLLDLRCHVMDGDTVVDTFAVGNFFDTEEAIRQIWKFLVIYMEQGPQALPESTFITTSTSRRWLNCFVMANVFCNNFARIPLIKWVFVALVTAMRWLVMHTCKDPVWPSAIEAESVIDKDDPYRLAEPSVTGEFAAKDPKLWAAVQEIARRRGKRR